MAPDHDLDEAATAPIPVLTKRPQWRDTFSSLRIHNYRLYVTAHAISTTSGWAMRIAIDWLVFELTGSVLLVGLIVALQFGPTLLFGPLGGLIADRLPKRRLLVITQSSTAVASGVLAALTLLQVVTVVHVFAITLVLGLLAVVEGPARAVFVTEMVGNQRLGNAISVNASIFHLGGMLGPAISGVLIALVGAGWSIAVNVLAAAVVVITLLSMRGSELLPTVIAKKAKGQIREAIRYAKRKPTIIWPILMLAFVATFGMNLPVLLVAFADDVFESGATGYGLFSSAAALGAFVGALLSTRRIGYRLRMIMLAAGVFGTMLVGAAISPTQFFFVFFLVGIGVFRLLFATTAESVVQLSSNRAIRGRVTSLYAMVLLGGQAIGGPVTGWIASEWGVRAATLVGGLVPTIAAIVIACILARSGRLALRFSAAGLTIQPR